MSDTQTVAGPWSAELAARQRTEEDLRGRELRYRTFTNATSDLVFLKDASLQLLTFAKGGDPVKEDLCLGSLIEEVAQFDLSGSNVRLQFRQVGEPWRAQADKGQPQQVISNLVIHARQAMHKGGRRWVTLEHAERREAPPPSAIGRWQVGNVAPSERDQGTA